MPRKGAKGQGPSREMRGRRDFSLSCVAVSLAVATERLLGRRIHGAVYLALAFCCRRGVWPLLLQLETKARKTDRKTTAAAELLFMASLYIKI